MLEQEQEQEPRYPDFRFQRGWLLLVLIPWWGCICFVESKRDPSKVVSATKVFFFLLLCCDLIFASNEVGCY